jgi:tape measure domain-containing protein
VYARNVGVLRALGYEANQAADFTEAMNHALVITATKGQQAASVQQALAKAMAVGKLQADGLETVLASGGRIAEAFADELGTTVNGLRAMASEGKITGNVMTDALLSSLEKLREEAGEMPATVADGFQRIYTGVQMLVGVFDQATGTTGAFAGALVSVGDALYDAAVWARENGDTIKTVVQTVIGSALIYGTGLMIQFGVSALTAGGQVSVLTGALGLLKSAIISTGFGVLIVGAGYLIGRFLELSEAVGGFGNAMVYLKELGLEVWERLQLGGGALVEGYKAYTAAFVLLWREAFATVINLFADFLDTILDGTRNAMLGAGNLAGAAAIEASRAAIKASIGQMQEGANAAVETQKELVAEHFKNAQQMAKDALAPLYMWQALNDVIDASRQKASGGASAAIPSTPVVPGTTGAANDNSDALKASQQTIASLQDEIDKLSLTDAAYRQLQVTKAWALAPTAEMADELLALGQKRDLLLAQAEAEERLKAAKGTLDDLRFEYELIGMTNVERAKAIVQRDLERQGVIEGTEAWNTYGEAILNAIDALETYGAQIEMFENMSRALGALSRGFGDLADAMGNSLGKQSAAYKAMFALQKAFSIASAIMAIRTAMAKAMAEGITIWERLANVAIVASSGASIISDIQSLAIGFREGGYTGNMGVNAVAGVVHGQEFVAHAEATRRWRPQLEAMNAGTYRPANDNGGGGTTVHINNYATGVEHEVRQIGPDEIEIIARRVVDQKAPGVIAGAIREPNSSVSKALKENISAPRRRA